MRLKVKRTGSLVAAAADAWLARAIAEYAPDAIFLPAGNTPKSLYARWREQKPEYLRNVKLLQLDEILDGPKAGLFQAFFKKELPDYIVEPPGEKPFAGKAIAILGLGINGHVAFHEPHVQSDFAFGEVELSRDSARELGIREGTRVRSYGLATFRECPAVLLLVTGEKKKDVLTRLLNKDPALPATALMGHPRFTILCDKKAKSNLERLIFWFALLFFLGSLLLFYPLVKQRMHLEFCSQYRDLCPK